MFRALKFKADQVTGPRLFQGQFVVRSWNLLRSICIPNLKCLWLLYRQRRQRKICTNSRFEPPFAGLRGNAQGLSMARWKAHCRLPISDNWTMFR